RQDAEAAVEAARTAHGLYAALRALRDARLPAALERYPQEALEDSQADETRRELRASYSRALDRMGPQAIGELQRWPQRLKEITQAEYSYNVRERVVRGGD